MGQVTFFAACGWIFICFVALVYHPTVLLLFQTLVLFSLNPITYRSGDWIDGIGVHWVRPLPGGSGGVPFDESNLTTMINFMNLQVGIWAEQEYILGLQVISEDTVGGTHGFGTVTNTDVVVSGTPYFLDFYGTTIQQVIVSQEFDASRNNNYISSLEFVAESGKRFGPFGHVNEANVFYFGGEGLSMVGYRGRSGDILDAVEFIFEPRQDASKRFGDLYDLLMSQLNENGQSKLNDHETPHFKALVWMADRDEAQVSINPAAPNLLQRYLLGVVFFAAAQGSHLTDMKKTSWLSPIDECQWSGVTCSDAGSIKSVDIGKKTKACKPHVRRYQFF